MIMHFGFCFGALITTVIAIPQQPATTPAAAILNCERRPTPPPNECRAAVAALPGDIPPAGIDGLHQFVKPVGNVPSPVDHRYTLPFSPTRFTCKVVVDLDVPQDHKGPFVEERFTWRGIQAEARRVLDTCIEQMQKEGYVYKLGLGGRLRVSIRHIRYHSGTPGNLTLPSSPDNPLIDTSAIS